MKRNISNKGSWKYIYDKCEWWHGKWKYKYDKGRWKYIHHKGNRKWKYMINVNENKFTTRLMKIHIPLENIHLCETHVCKRICNRPWQIHFRLFPDHFQPFFFYNIWPLSGRFFSLNISDSCLTISEHKLTISWLFCNHFRVSYWLFPDHFLTISLVFSDNFQSRTLSWTTKHHVVDKSGGVTMLWKYKYINDQMQLGHIRCGTEGTHHHKWPKAVSVTFLIESFLVNLFRELDIRVFVLIPISNIHVCLTSCNSFKKCFETWKIR